MSCMFQLMVFSMASLQKRGYLWPEKLDEKVANYTLLHSVWSSRSLPLVFFLAGRVNDAIIVVCGTNLRD